MFRAQRNFYLAGFTVLLWFILRRLVTSISRTASLQADADTMRKQAESANAVAKQLMEDKDNKSNEREERAEKQATSTTDGEITKLKEELSRAQKDLDAMRRQAESTKREWDRLSDEHQALQTKYNQLEGSGDSKKDD
jgi:B-cell receptor-associated protein 31